MDVNMILEKYLPVSIKSRLLRLDSSVLDSINEIRLRLDKPLCIRKNNTDYFVEKYIVTEEDISRTLDLISDYSIYAYNKELAKGYITLQGGCRVGVGGSLITENGIIKGFSFISSMNIRIPRQVKGCSERLISYIAGESFENTLIISPPACGKTTLLRDIVRVLSDRRYNISLIDERSEVAFLYNGSPQNDVGKRTDIIDGCDKSQGIIMAIRSLAPQIIAVDEIGGNDDIRAIELAVNSGVGLLCTLHGEGLSDIMQRKNIRHIIDNGFFKRYIFLKGGTAGSIGSVLNQELKEIWQG